MARLKLRDLANLDIGPGQGAFVSSSGTSAQLTPQGWISDSGELLAPNTPTPSFDMRQPVDYMGRRGFMQMDRSIVDPSGNLLYESQDSVKRRQAQEQARRQAEKDAAENEYKRSQTLKNLFDAGVLQPQSPPGFDNAAIARELGVPTAPNVFGGLSEKVRDKLQEASFKTGEKQLAGQEEDARASESLARDAERFKQLLQDNTTGKFVGSAPVAWLRGAFGDAGVEEMQSISNRLVPKMREPGSGSTSDFDARMFQSAMFGTATGKQANEAIANGLIAKAKLDRDRVDFFNAYLTANKTLRGADSAWSQYLSANPIFDPENTDVPTINKSRVKWREYFSQGGQPQRPPLSSFER